MTDDTNWKLDAFERLVYARDREGAARMMLGLLRKLDANYGRLGEGFFARATGGNPEDLDANVLTRLGAAMTCLFSDSEFFLSIEGLTQMLACHRWLGTVFAATSFVNADHILHCLNLRPDEGFEISLAQMNKFCVLYSVESNIALDMNALYEKDRLLAVGLGLVLVSPRFLGSASAHAKREILLGWLTDKLPLIDSMDQLPVNILHDVYMHCSYADRADRHAVKKSINGLIRHTLHAQGVQPRRVSPTLVAGRKPVMLVVLEWFSKGHSIYRTHSRTLEAARTHFEVVAVTYSHTIDDITREVFDRVIEIDASRSMIDQMKNIVGIADECNAQVLYMPSVGMFPLTMFLTNLRVAPIQVMALGHPATTHSQDIDYVIVEEDYVGDPGCFSEELLVLPADGMPYRPSRLIDEIVPLYRQTLPDDTVNIVVAATTMKLNPSFMETCAEIAKQASRPVKFHFLVGQAVGLVIPNVNRTIRQYLGEMAQVYPHQNYPEYLQIIARADLFLNPFPFGNTNGIIDTVSSGLVGVCKTGPEVFEHIDEGLFRRLGFPEWLIATSREAYRDAALRLINDPDERMALRKTLTGPQAVTRLFEGRPEIMGRMLLDKLTAIVDQEGERRKKVRKSERLSNQPGVAELPG